MYQINHFYLFENPSENRIINLGSGLLREGSYLNHLISGRRGLVSFLLELTNFKDRGRKEISTKNAFYVYYKEL